MCRICVRLWWSDTKYTVFPNVEYSILIWTFTQLSISLRRFQEEKKTSTFFLCLGVRLSEGRCVGLLWWNFLEQYNSKTVKICNHNPNTQHNLENIGELLKNKWKNIQALYLDSELLHLWLVSAVLDGPTWIRYRLTLPKNSLCPVLMQGHVLVQKFHQDLDGTVPHVLRSSPASLRLPDSSGKKCGSFWDGVYQ